jgi:putative membrane protein
MKFLMAFLVALVAFEHLYFMILEMFFWTKPKGLKVFGLTMEKAESSKVLAANQGLYNGFLAVGLLWGLLTEKNDVILYFLVCVVIAGIYGSYSTKKIRLFYVQALPALLALAVTLLI